MSWFSGIYDKYSWFVYGIDNAEARRQADLDRRRAAAARAGVPGYSARRGAPKVRGGGSGSSGRGGGRGSAVSTPMMTPSAPRAAPAFEHPVTGDPDADTAIHKARIRVDDLRQRSGRAQVEAAELLERAKNHNANKLRPQALNCLRQRREKLNHATTFEAAAGKIEEQLIMAETMAISRESIETMRDLDRSMRTVMNGLGIRNLTKQVDELEDGMDGLKNDASELQDTLSRLFASPAVDEDDLMADLEGLGDDEGLLADVPSMQSTRRTVPNPAGEEYDLLPALPNVPGNGRPPPNFPTFGSPVLEEALLK